MKIINVLVTTVGGLTSPDILSALKNTGKYDVTLFGIDAFKFAVGKEFVDHFEVLSSSGCNELEFVHAIKELVLTHKIDVIIPCGNEDNLTLAKYRSLIPCIIMVGEYKDLAVAYDKAKVYSELKNSMPQHAPKYHVVRNYAGFLKAVKDLGYPNKRVVVKPRFGIGGRGVYILGGQFDFTKVFNSKPTNEYPYEFVDDILKNKGDFDDLIIMEYLSAPFYSAYSVCKNGKNIFTLSHIREWGNASQTFRGSVCYDETIEMIASQVISKFNLSYTNNMELAVSDNGRIVLFDLNPRIGASSGIDRDIGFNFPLEAMKLALGENIESVDKNSFRESKIFVRYFQQIWLS